MFGYEVLQMHMSSKSCFRHAWYLPWIEFLAKAKRFPYVICWSLYVAWQLHTYVLLTLSVPLY